MEDKIHITENSDLFEEIFSRHQGHPNIQAIAGATTGADEDPFNFKVFHRNSEEELAATQFPLFCYATVLAHVGVAYVRVSTLPLTLLWFHVSLITNSRNPYKPECFVIRIPT